MFTRAITRRPGPELVQGLTTAGLGPPDWRLALAQHDAYVAALRGLGLEVTVLPDLPGHPDACFVEDVAVVVPGLAVITRPGAHSRRGETASVAAALAADRELTTIREPGCLDGGDVLIAGRTCWIGLSARTNAAGADQLAALLGARGYDCRFVPVGRGLHLKSTVNHVGGRTLIVAEGRGDEPAFADWELLTVPAAESYASCTLLVNGTLLVPAGFPATAALLQELGLPQVEIAVGEFRKVDGGLTCLSLRF